MESNKVLVNENLLDTKHVFSSCEFGLDTRLMKAIARMQFIYATLVQVYCIPLALQGKDLLVRARTGSGKTAAFSLPLLHKLLMSKQQDKRYKEPKIQVLILVPTKELVDQTKSHIVKLIYYCHDVISVLGLSGQSMLAQQALLRDIPDILIATPGRLVAHLNAKNLDLSCVQTLVIDEADLVLSFGYGDNIRSIFNHLPKACQHFCMSATLSPELEALKATVLHNPAIVKLEEGDADGKLQQYYLSVPGIDKDLLLYALLKLGVVHGKVIFFVNSIDNAYRLKLFFEQFLIKAAVLNAQLPFNSRQHIIQEFNRGLFDYLIATDEGIDKDEDDQVQDLEVTSNEDQEIDEKDDSEDNDIEEKDEDDDNESDQVEDNESDISEDEELEQMDQEDGNESSPEDAESENSELNPSDNESDQESIYEAQDEETEDINTKTQALKTKKKHKKYQKDANYGVSRGVDFHGVAFVVNVDFPTSVRAYTHRIGRTARGGNNGTALSLISPESKKESKMLIKVQKSQKAVLTDTKDLLQQPAELAFDMKEIDCFRYRVEDVRRAVTRVAIREAQLADVKQEIVNSEKLTAHFEANPRELALLAHDQKLGTASVQPHLATVPDYLVPIALQASVGGNTTKSKKKRLHRSKKDMTGKRNLANDPLHSFTHNEENEDGQAVKKAKTAANGVPEDRITFGNSGVGKSTSGRQKWKQAHRKGRFNPKTMAKQAHKAKKGFKH